MNSELKNKWLVVMFASLAASVFPAGRASAQGVEGGKFGRALKVADGQYGSATYNPIYFVIPLTVDCWVKVPPKPAGDIALLASQPRHSRDHWHVFVDGNTGGLCGSFPGYTPKVVKATTSIADGEWHYIAMVFDAKSLSLYIDAKPAASADIKRTSPYPDVGPLTFGYMEGGRAAVGALIDEVRISSVIRPMDKLPTAPFTADKDTIGLWHFDENAAAYDKSGFADSSLPHNPARIEIITQDAIGNGGFDGTRGSHTRWADMDFGSFFSSTLGLPKDKTHVTPKAISIRFGKDRKYAMAFDTDLLRVSAGWTGDFVKIYNGREGLAGHPDVAGEVKFMTELLPGWSKPSATGKAASESQALASADPRPDKLGPLPSDWAKYKGLYVNGDRVILSYTVGESAVLETPGVEEFGKSFAFTRTFSFAPSKHETVLRVCDVEGESDSKAEDAVWSLTTKKDKTATAAALVTGATDNALWEKTRTAAVNGKNAALLLRVPAHEAALHFKLLIWTGPAAEKQAFDEFVAKGGPKVEDLAPLTQGGPGRFPQAVATKGELGKPDSKSDGAFVVDTLTAPDDNPWKSFIRFGGVDFFKNGNAALCSASGDVWVVSGIDDKLENLKWRRYATGMFQPLGLKIVDDQVYVLGRDQITRLHDLNNDGEADFYENFNNDCKVTPGNGHAYTTSLETDAEGNFYYCKCGDSTRHGGTVLRVDKYGKQLDVFATGVRNSNGLGGSPRGVITEADNEGEWVPASRIDIVKQGLFLGYTPMAHADKPPTEPGKPIIWMPQDIDNSSGGQTWVVGNRWGLPDGQMLHTSYGQASLLHVMTEEVDGITQAGIFRFPFRFATGVMRGRFREADGQLYLCGLRGWQTAGVKDGALQRVRYTGKPMHQPAELHIRKNGILLTFTCPLDKKTAADAESFSILQWNYKWSAAYGSAHQSVREPRQGYDQVEVKSAKLLKDGRTVFLEIPDLRPAMTTKITYNLDAADGVTMQNDVHCTIHALGPAFAGEEK